MAFCNSCHNDPCRCVKCPPIQGCPPCLEYVLPVGNSIPAGCIDTGRRTSDGRVILMCASGVNLPSGTQTVPCGFGMPAPQCCVTVQDEGVPVKEGAAFLNVVGDGIEATAEGTGVRITHTPDCVAVKEDGSLVSPCPKFINITGDGATVVLNGAGVDIDVGGAAPDVYKNQTLIVTAPHFLDFVTDPNATEVQVSTEIIAGRMGARIVIPSAPFCPCPEPAPTQTQPPAPGGQQTVLLGSIQSGSSSSGNPLTGVGMPSGGQITTIIIQVTEPGFASWGATVFGVSLSGSTSGPTTSSTAVGPFGIPTNVPWSGFVGVGGGHITISVIVQY